MRYRRTNAKGGTCFFTVNRVGTPRLTRRLKPQGSTAGRRQVAQSLRRQGLRAKAARKYTATTNSNNFNHRLPVADNLLQQNFTADQPNKKWVSDITYLGTDENWVHLATVLDLYSRKIIGWSMSARMTTSLVSDAPGGVPSASTHARDRAFGSGQSVLLA